jgi:ribosomal protein L6P/L9E
MSRIGKAPITIPAKVQVEVMKGNVVKVKGPQGELFQTIDPDITVKDRRRYAYSRATYRAEASQSIAWYIPCAYQQHDDRH